MNNKQKKFVFVLMPFDSAFDDIYNYGIKQPCKDLNAYCERVDEQIFTERILDRIYNQISKADILVADMSNRNPNVFYEVGYAHGIGKDVILLTQNSDDIPFDLKHFQHIVYNGKIHHLSEQLRKKIEWFLSDENSNNISEVNFNLEFLINGTQIKEGAIIDIEPISKTWGNEYSNLKLDIYNNSNYVYRTKFRVGFEFLGNDNYISELEMIKPTKEKILNLSKELFNIYPYAYKSFDFKFKLPTSVEERFEEYALIECKLKIFTIVELKEINFKFRTPFTVAIGNSF